MNIGHSSRLPYDDCAYDDKLEESVSPLKYRLDTHRIQNCDACLSTLGPRSGHQGYGVSTTSRRTPATSQDLVDVESILSNRNVLTSRCKTEKVNPVDVTKFTLDHARICNDYLNPEATRLSYPPYNYRDMSINRFYNLPRDPQANIFWDFSVNTTLEAKDNFMPNLPRQADIARSLPREVQNQPGQCFTCEDSRCPIRR